MNEEIIDKNKIFFKKYRAIERISQGLFGKVYLGENIINKKLVALKLEDRKNIKRKTLEKEAYFLYYLKGYGIPELISYGYSGKYNILVETLLGKSLYEINLKKKFTLKDICLIGIQILDRLKYIHSKYVIHCDIKPQNCLVGNINSSIIYICDFGTSQKYRNLKTGEHIKLCKLKRFYLSMTYSSINSILGYQQSRRDDLESLGYMLIFLKNGLPWDKIKSVNINDYKNKLLYSKKTISLNKLCKGFPNEMISYFKYVRNLGFEEKPNYSFLKNIFFEILFKINEKCDYIFSWNKNNKNKIIFKNKSYINNIKESILFKRNILLNKINKVNKTEINSNVIRKPILFRNEEHHNSYDNILKYNITSFINYWTKLAEKNNHLLSNHDIDLEAENNFIIDY